ncbi:tetratricopeptide repeat protein [bacterium]|nr:tetratricopeptide repeat protein [bacterium]
MKQGFRDRLVGFVDTIETMPITPGRWLLMLGAIITLRHFLEQVSGQLKTIDFLAYFLHYPLAYITPLLALTIVLAVMARERIERVTKLMLFAWLLTLLPPLLDLLLAGGVDNPELIGYLIPDHSGLGAAFLNLLNPFYHGFQGATAGIRIEAAVGCILAAVYVHLKTRSLARSILTFIVVYPTMFFFFTLPSITVAVTRLFGAQIDNVYQLLFARANVYRAFVNVTPFGLSNLSNSLIDLLVLMPVLKIWYVLHDRERSRALTRSIDVPLIGLHLVATAAGIVLGARLLMGSTGFASVAHPFDLISIIGLIAATLLAAQTATFMRLRFAPRTGETPTPEEQSQTTQLGLVTMTLALLFSLSVSYVALTYVIATLAVYALYYMPPFRLGRYTPLAGLMIGGVVLFALSLGYCAYAGEQTALWLPTSIVTLAIVSPMLAFLARDVWDSSAGDTPFSLSAARLSGERTARIVAGTGLLLAALVPAAVLREPLFAIPGIVVGVVGLIALLRIKPAAVPGTVAGLGLVLLVALLAMGLTTASNLSDDLSRTSFAGASRRSGSFEFMEKADATEQQGLLNDGIVLMRGGDIAGAIANFRRAIEIDPKYMQAYASLGSAQLRIEDLEGAERSFRRAIEIDGENAFALVGLGQTYKLFDQTEQAIEYLERALEIDPQSVDATYTLALIYQADEDTPNEVEALIRTVSIDGRHSFAFSRLADIYLANGLHEQAIAALNAAQSGRTPVEHIHTRLADAHYSMGDFETAETELRREITLRPRTVAPRANLARLLTEQGRIEDAKTELRQAIEIAQDARLKSLLEQELVRLGG